MAAIPHILVVDDHKEIRESLRRFLEKSGMRVTTASDAKEAETALGVGQFDLMVLDIMMPGEDGLSFYKRMSMDISIPTIMLTALGDEVDRIVGLEVGADDYLPKPFNPRELLARIKSVLRRAQNQEPVAGTLSGKNLKFAHLVLDTDKQVLIDENNVQMQLSTSEFKLLIVFLQRARLILNRDQLLDLAFARSAGPLNRTIDNQVSRLRKKIEPDILRPTIIKTVRNGGYCLAAEVEEI